MRTSYMKELDMEMWARWNEDVKGKFFYNVPSQSTVDIAEMKMDRKVTLVTDIIKKHSICMVDQILEPVLTHLAWSDEDVYNHIDMDKGPSVPMKYMGFSTRKEYAVSDHWIAVKDDIDSLTELGILYASVPKEEYAKIEDWLVKSRTFCIPGFHVLFWQAKCFGQGNFNLKKFWWSKYGFCPFGGGTRSLWESMNQTKKNGKFKFPVRISWDAKGYDRVVSLHNVADRRHRCFCKANPERLHKFSAWITKGLKISMIILSNGDVVFRVTGNNSGSGMTTTNNIEAGMEIMCDILCYVYHMKKGRLPTLKKIAEQIVALFGDDNMSALANSFSLILNQKLVSDRLMASHGMELKFFQGGYEYPLKDLTFLGFSMVKFRDQILPRWPIDRLLLPLCYSKDKLCPDRFVQRFYAILIMSYAHPQWEQLRLDYLACLMKLSTRVGSPMVKLFVTMGAPTDLQLKYFYSGLELGGGGPFRYTTMADIEVYDDGDGSWLDLIRSLEEDALISDQFAMKEGVDYPCTAPKPEVEQVLWNEPSLQKIVEQKWSCECPECELWEATEDHLVGRHSADLPITEMQLDSFGYCNPSIVQLLKQQMQYRDHQFFTNSPTLKVWMNLTLLRSQEEEDHDSKAGEGTFNQYGNEQMAAQQYTLTKPTFKNVGLSWTCVSTCLLPSPTTIIGVGDTNIDAFIDWHNQVDVYVDLWAPVDMGPITVFVRNLRTVKVEKGHPLYNIISAPDEGEAVKSFWTTFMEGSFNKYGNGQIIQTYSQWVTSEGSKVATLTEPQRRALYRKYVANKKKSLKGPPPRVVRKRPDRKLGKYQVSPPKARTTGLEKRAEIKLSGCARGYATALKCPFWFKDRSCAAKVASLKVNPEMNPCIPMFPAIKTRKFYANAAGTMGAPVGFEGAFIAFAPWRLANDNDTTKDVAPAILFTRSAVGGVSNAFPVMDTGGVWNNGASNLNTDYNTASLINVGGVGIKYRVVGAGLRIKYTGNMINASGIAACVEQSDHETLSAQTMDNVAQLDSYFSVSVVSAMEKQNDPWIYLTYTPVAMDDFDFNDDTIANATWPNVGNKNHFIGILLSGIPVGGDFFSWEAIVHYEAIGQAVRGKTDTPADPLGTASVLNSIKPETQKKNNTAEPVKAAISEGARDMSLSGMVNAVTSTVKEVVPLLNAVL